MSTGYTRYPVSGGSGSGDVVGPGTAPDGAIALFDGTTGKLVKAATGTGLVKAVSGVYSAATLVNADVSSSAAIAYSKLALTGTIVNADVSASAAIAYTKLTLTGSVVNADISASAAIAYTKLALTGTIVNADISASAAIAYSKLALATSIVNADISTSAAIAYSKLASMSTGQVLLGNAGTPTATALTGDVTVGATGITAIGATKVTNAMLAGSIDLTTKVTGALPIGNGGTGQITKAAAFDALSPMSAVGDIVYGGTSGTGTRLAPNTVATLKFLTQTGTGTIGAAPVWNAIQAADVPALSYVKTVKTQIFTASGTYTPSSNMLYCIVELQGGGGGGGGAVGSGANIAAGGGGGGGGYARKLISAATIGGSQTVTIGAGGTAGPTTGGTFGGTGGTTSLGSLVTAVGGTGGQVDSAGHTVIGFTCSGGAGGSFTLADYGINGSTGGNGLPLSSGQGWPGNGGGSHFGGVILSPQGSAQAAGNTGISYGGGGSGALSVSVGQTGGVGAPGIMVITEFCST